MRAAWSVPSLATAECIMQLRTGHRVSATTPTRAQCVGALGMARCNVAALHISRCSAAASHVAACASVPTHPLRVIGLLQVAQHDCQEVKPERVQLHEVKSQSECGHGRAQSRRREPSLSGDAAAVALSGSPVSHPDIAYLAGSLQRRQLRMQRSELAVPNIRL